MVRAGSSPGGQRPAPVPGWILPPLAMAACTVVAVVLVSSEARLAVLICGAVGTIAVALVAAEAIRRGRALTELRRRTEEQESLLKQQLVQQEAETVRLARELLPAAVARLQQGEFAEDVLVGINASEQLAPDFQAAHDAVVRSVVEAVQAEEDLRESAHRAFVNIARRVQAIVHQQATDLREMEDRHGQSPEVFGDLLRLDHGTALIGRLADSIAVLGGARPGRQWTKSVPLFSVMRGAMSRIIDYQRVELHSVSEVAVVGPAVEPLIHALAELLDNATRYSPPQAQVHLTAVEVQAGIAVEIEDGGVGLSEEARARAERMLREAQAGIDLNDLGETPRLGLAVVGRLSQSNRFQVSLRPSAYGGVRAVLIVPQDLITTGTATGRAHGIGAASGPRPAATPSGSATASRTSAPSARQQAVATEPQGAPTNHWDEDEIPVVHERTAQGLPQRRRRAPSSAGAAASAPAQAAPAPPARTSAPEPDPVQPGVWLADFQSGLAGGAPADSSRNISDDPSDKGEQS
ncbi:ATP-binding protein [Streptomyces sp. AJS327]|uniref:ATP-binding protein n=1 Tax=Streptomyces sp. AJS327 TaxID=2545265 RepID=UPI00215574E9|nr:ATP-binding protein [Streptomyces sp. AJS327]